MKRCFKCARDLPLTEFYRHPRMSDGHLGKCRSCTRRDVRENREKRRSYYLAYDRSRKRDVPPRKKERKGAAQAVYNAIKRGKMVRGACRIGVDCRGRVEAHHVDYSRPLDVMWLCKKHHAMQHRIEEAA